MGKKVEEPARLLLVDDDVAVRRAVRTFIEWSCPELEVVGEAGDGRTALQRVEELDPDVVLMDIRMPILDGLETTRILKRVWHHRAAVVLMTSLSLKKIEDEAQAVGAARCLRKPFRLPELRAALLEAVDSGGGGFTARETAVSYPA